MMVPVLSRGAKGKSKKENGPPFLPKARDGKECAQTISLVHRLVLAGVRRQEDAAEVAGYHTGQ